MTLAPSHGLALLLLLAPACAGGDGDDTGTGATSITSAATTVDTSSGEPTTDAGTSTGDTSTGGTSSTGAPELPPPECGALSVCGQLCVDLAVDPGNCGQCGVSCVIPHASPACTGNACAIASCDPGWTDCDGDPQNGCELLGPGDQCTPMCKEGQPEACNLLDDNCDGQCDEGNVPGCRQPVHRASSPTLGHFYTLDAAEAMSGDFKPEFLNYFYMHVAAAPGLVPLYRCLKGDNRRFYTTSDTCEGAGPVEGTLGYLGTQAVCGAVPLYRLYGAGDHFYTTSDAERDNAVAMFGYLFEAQVGFVWPAP
jgi:hypothetical protein